MYTVLIETSNSPETGNHKYNGCTVVKFNIYNDAYRFARIASIQENIFGEYFINLARLITPTQTILFWNGAEYTG